ncbi:MAG: tRNA lysidine(34) synthetase TilS [Rhodospirillales bacterium]
MNAVTPAPGMPGVEAAFRDGMAFCGPFEPEPAIAVGASGGGDSTALLLLADNFARSRGGRVIALTIDHRLRPDSAAEAEKVAAFCRERDIEHHILAWQHDGVSSAIQARARAARYRLMTGWCRENGILHLALAHNRNDQAETRAMRNARAPGGPGAAGMAAMRLEGGVRIVRPLLDIGGAELRAWLAGRRVGWIEDPSNRDHRYERIRVRQSDMSSAVPEQAPALRTALEREAALVAARHLRLSPLGFAGLSHDVLEAPGDARDLLLAAILAAVSGSDYRVPMHRAADLVSRLRSGIEKATFGGCLVSRKRGDIVICREHARAPMMPISAAGGEIWDGRFRLDLHGNAEEGFSVGPAGRSAMSLKEHSARTGVPGDVLRGLPGLFRDRKWCGFAELPGLGRTPVPIAARFSPVNAVLPVARWLVPATDEPMLALVNRS